MCICYHGTDAAAADVIREEGFRQYTYFARHLEDAIGFGGEYVFEVAFYEGDIEDFGWQFTASEHVPADRIVRLNSYEVTQFFENEALKKEIFESNKEK